MNNLIVDNILKVDFGDIDGLYDSNLAYYFFDDQYWEKIIKSDVFYVIGRKGSGKSAICRWLYNQQESNGSIISLMSFKDFPFEKLLQLDDKHYSKPNQYQSIWRNIILSEIARMIYIDANSVVNESYNYIHDYLAYHFGTSLIDLHKEITTQTERRAGGLEMGGVSASNSSENSINLGSELRNITQINNRLSSVIKNYLKTTSTNQYVIQFDQLDDNYNAYSILDDYFQAIISLLKVVYDIDQTFKYENIPVKVVVYLRSDIFNSINDYDAESARWDGHKYYIDWAIINKSDWGNPKLMQMINRRICNSLPPLNFQTAFSTLFDTDNLHLWDSNKKISLFKYITHRSFHRPRDIIQFCKKIQAQVLKDRKMNARSIVDAEKEYSAWFLSEIKNEMAPVIDNLSALYELLRKMGSGYFDVSDFNIQYESYQDKIQKEPLDLLHYLYSLGVIFNFSDRDGSMYSIIRNQQSTFNDNMKIGIHRGFYKSLCLHNY